MLCWFLLYNNVNQPQVYIYPLPLEPSSHTPHPTPLGHHRTLELRARVQSSLCYIAASHQLSISHMVMYTCQCYYLNSCHPLLPPLCPQVHSLHISSLSLEIGSFPCAVFNCVWLFATPWTGAPHAPLSMGLSRQEYWSRLPFPTPGGLPDPGIKPTSLTSPELAWRFFTTVLPNRFISAIFLDSIYICINPQYLVFFLTYFTLYNGL